MSYIVRNKLERCLKPIINYNVLSTNSEYRRCFSTISQEIRNKFLQFGGGSVSLRKDSVNGLAEIYFDHHERRNAFSGKMMIELADIVSDLENWNEGKSLLLHSPGDVFCSGADLSMVTRIANPKDGFEMACVMHDALNRLYDLPLISAAILKGKAIGGGAELLTACDFRLATSRQIEIQFVQVKMGVVTGWGGGTRLSHLVGSSNALEILISAQKLNHDDCARLGLISDTLEEGEDCVERAKEWLVSRTNGAAPVVRGIKNIIANSRKLSREQSLMEEKNVFASVWGGYAQKRILERINKTAKKPN